MADSILRLQVESQEYDAKLKRATEGLQRYVDGCRKVGGTLEVVEKDTLDYVKAVGQMETVSRSATGKLSEMKRAFTELSMQYKQMTTAEQQSPMGKALSQSLDQLNGRIAETKKQMDDVSRDMNGGGGLGGALDALAGKFGLNIGQLTKLGTALGAAKVSFDTIRGAIESNEATHDTLARAIAVTDNVTNQFLRTLATADFSTFINGLQGVINTTIDAYNAMDEFESYAVRFQPWQQAKESEISTKIQQARAAKAQGDTKRAEQLNNEARALIEDLAASTKAYGKKQTEGGYATIRRLVGTVNITDKQIAWYADPKNWEKAKSKAEEYVKIQERIEQLHKQGSLGLNTFKMPGETDAGYDMRIGEATSENSRLEEYLKKNPSLQRAYIIQNLRDSGDSDEAQALRQAFSNIYGNTLAESRISALRARADRMDGVLSHTSPSGGGSNSGKGGGSTTTDPITKAADEVVKAEQSYAENINVAQEKLMANVMKSEEYDKLVLSGQERLADAYLKAYNTTGNDKYLDAFRETSEHILDMRGVVDANIQAQKLAEQATREQAEAAKKLAEAERKRSEQYANWHSNSTSGIGSYISYQHGVLGQQTIGTSDYAQVASNLADANAYKNLMQVAIQNGLNDLVVDAAPLWQKIIGEVDVQDSTWKELQDKINIKLKELGIEPIKIDFATGRLSGESKGGEKHENQIGKVVSGMTSITNSLQHIGVEIPEGFNKVINIMNIIQTILTTVGSFGSAGSFLSGIPLIGGFFSLFGLANGGVVHAANGFSGIVPGNLMSGDQIPALLNSGEVVLNRAQAGVLASDMRQGSIGYEGRTQAVIESDQIKLVLRNGAQARGMTLSDYLEL